MQRVQNRMRVQRHIIIRRLLEQNNFHGNECCLFYGYFMYLFNLCTYPVQLYYLHLFIHYYINTILVEFDYYMSNLINILII